MAGLAAETGTAIFRIAFERWVNPANKRTLACLISDTFDDLKAIAAGA